jgi:hypothetical protein
MLDLKFHLINIKMIKIEKFADGLTMHDSTTTKNFGVIRVTESAITINNGFIKETKKSAIIRGEKNSLQMIIDNPSLLEGSHIQIIEKLESELNDGEIYVPENTSYAEVLERFSKRAGVDGPVLKVNGERIIRYTKVTSNTNDKDIIVNHDNVEEVKAWTAALKAAAGATIPSE